MAGFGAAIFRILDHAGQEVALVWDEQGFASICKSLSSAQDCILATSADEWRKFLNGEYGAAEGVLLGRLKYQGRLGRLVPYAGAFSDVRRIARLIS